MTLTVSVETEWMGSADGARCVATQLMNMNAENRGTSLIDAAPPANSPIAFSAPKGEGMRLGFVLLMPVFLHRVPTSVNG